MKNSLQFAGEIDLLKLEIMSLITGEYIDISTLFIEMNIFESIHTNTIGGSLTINESLNISTILPLVGEEILNITYRTPTFSKNDEISKTFIIYKIGNKYYNAEKALVYNIFFMSVEEYTNSNMKLSKSYNGQISYIADKLFSTTDGLNSDRDIFIEETYNAFRFVIPMWSPIKTLNYIAARSVSKEFKTANYLFYEDMKQFNFRSISSLINVAIPFAYYQYNQLSPRQLREMGEDVDTFSIIREFIVPLEFDIITRKNNGFYASKLLNFDLLTKSLNIKELNYFDTFKDRPHMDQDLAQPVSSIGQSKNSNSCVQFYPTATYMYDDYDTDNPMSWVLERKMLMEELELHKVQIIVPGRSDMTVGKIIYIDYNTVQTHNSPIDAKDDLYSGNYLVTSINHRISLNEHEMIITCVKDNILRNLDKRG